MQAEWEPDELIGAWTLAGQQDTVAAEAQAMAVVIKAKTHAQTEKRLYRPVTLRILYRSSSRAISSGRKIHPPV